ncbi:hypothetical protein VUR80DRAFT_9997 [Thermomyces stellatus]
MLSSINLPIGGASAVVIFLFFHAPANAVPAKAALAEKVLQMDIPGTALVMGAVISFILAFQYGGQEKPWSSSEVIGLLVGFGLITAAFVVLEWYQSERAMINGRILGQRTVWVSGLYAFFYAGAYFTLVYYLPIYFQSIGGTSPTTSGVRNLPLIIAVTIATIVSGGLITATGVYAPILVGGAAVATIASGLLYTLDIDTSTGKWIGYQILAGAGYGISFQVPMIATQGTVAPADLAPSTATVMFFQTVGGAFYLAAAQSAFLNEMVKRLVVTAPTVDPRAVVATGASELRKFPEDVLPGILQAYMWGIKIAIALAIVGAGVSFFASLASRWKKLNTKNVSGGV